MQGAVCGDRVYKMERRMMVKLRGGTAELRVETGRWCGLSRGEQCCKNCNNGAVGKVFNPVAKLVLENQPFLMPEPAVKPSLQGRVTS